ncbi:hypothetical protein [Roseateles sp.]|jgi:hypothetical protein|uniref:hypothetical protein n=1 Tax=Roseateles sp. TaxID=1971397 RepID=UPI003918F382
MVFPQAAVWNRESADISRENVKRESSPCSFFCSQGRSLCLAAEYFSDHRLDPTARGGVAGKHRHKNQLAIYGQLMAAFEYMLKDFVAKAIDATSAFDDKIKKMEWLNVTTDRVLSQRVVQTTVGAMLVHPTLGWHTPGTVDERFKSLFGVPAFNGTEVTALNTLWVLRHSVAHNAGFVTAHDAARINQPALAEKVAHIDDEFIKATFEFLKVIAQRLPTTCGKSILKQWFGTVKEYGIDFSRDQPAYARAKLLATCVVSRTEALPDITEQIYAADWAIYAV